MPSTQSVQSRAQACIDMMNAAPNQGRLTERTRGNFRLVITEVPTLLLDNVGALIGIECKVRLYRVNNGVEIPIDPVRRIVNPPTKINGVVNPLGALWSALQDSIETAPNPAGWVAP